ncbi:MAG: SDR family oxidoreductase, partial [Candidatus Eremiobacteraeota bacterium]|nr:SDR family oxidoreductase [Candidatus Eremiobacteraeota bacterium]
MSNSNSKLAVVTGAGVRLGKATAVKLAQSGYDVVVHYNSSLAPAQETAAAVEESGSRAHLVQADLSTEEGVAELAKAIAGISAELHVLVNNASIFYPTGSPEDWVKNWDRFQMVNLKSPFLLSVKLLPLLRETKGCIVNIVDIWARFPLRRFLPYSVAKSGLEALTKSLALELAPDIRVNGVSPGAALPPPNSDDSMDKMLSQVPMQRYGGAESIAEAVEYLARAQYVTGQI